MSNPYPEYKRNTITLPVYDKLAALMEQPAPPPECQTEAEKTAYAFGWFKALESVRKRPAEQEPMTTQTEADRLANQLDYHREYDLGVTHTGIDEQAAAELRRQQAEIERLNEALASAAKEQPAKDEFKAAYIEAMVASNEAGFAGMSAAETIRELSRMVAEQPAQTQQEPVEVKQISEALRQVGLTLVRTNGSFRVMDLGRIEAQPAQPSKPWVGLTDDEILYCVELENPKAIAEEVEAKLREKNQ